MAPAWAEKNVSSSRRVKIRASHAVARISPAPLLKLTAAPVGSANSRKARNVNATSPTGRLRKETRANASPIVAPIAISGWIPASTPDGQRRCGDGRHAKRRAGPVLAQPLEDVRREPDRSRWTDRRTRWSGLGAHSARMPRSAAAGWSANQPPGLLVVVAATAVLGPEERDPGGRDPVLRQQLAELGRAACRGCAPAGRQAAPGRPWPRAAGSRRPRSAGRSR